MNHKEELRLASKFNLNEAVSRHEHKVKNQGSKVAGREASVKQN